MTINSINWYKKYKLILSQSFPKGEWWIINGQALFADGDSGEMNHEAYVIDFIQRKYSYDEFQHDEWVDWIGFKKKIAQEAYQETYNIPLSDKIYYEKKYPELTNQNNPDNPEIEKLILQKLKELGMSQEEYIIAEAKGDARTYGLQELQWKRVKDNNVETQTLTHEDLMDISKGLWDAYDENCENQYFNILVINTHDFYQDIPYALISDGAPSQLRAYTLKYAQFKKEIKESQGVSPSNIYCINDAIQNRTDIVPSLLRKNIKNRKRKKKFTNRRK